MEELNILKHLDNGSYYVNVMVDKTSDLGDITHFIWVMHNRKEEGIKPLIFKLCTRDNNVLAYHLEFKDELLFSFISTPVFQKVSNEEYWAYVDDVDTNDENTIIVSLVMFPEPEVYKQTKNRRKNLTDKLLEELGRVNLYDRNVAPPVWVCYNYGAERQYRECCIYGGKGCIYCKVEDIEQQKDYKYLYKQLSKGDIVILKEDGDYAIGIYWSDRKIGNIESRNVPAVALCISKEGTQAKICEKWDDEYRISVSVPATFIRIEDQDLEKKYGPYTFEIKIVKKIPSWQEYRFEVSRDKFKQIFYYEDPSVKKYNKEELLEQPLPDLTGLNCREDIEIFAMDFLRFIRLLGNIKTLQVKYFPFKKSASIDFSDYQENFSFNDHKNEIEDYLKSNNTNYLSYKLEYWGVTVKFKL